LREVTQFTTPTPTTVEEVGFYFRLSVCLYNIRHDISKTDAARITKLNLDIFQNEFWKSIYSEVKRSKVKVTSDVNIVGVGLCTLVSAGFF